MVLLGRIELPTSSLPMTRSTTELQQQSISSPQHCTCFGGRAYGRPSVRCQGGLRLTRHFAYALVMAETQDEKKARLAQALRDNLRRRKTQTREASRESAREETEPLPPAHDPKD